MVRLDLPRSPYWLDLPHGVRLRVRPLDTALDAAARSQATARLREQAKAEAPSGEVWRFGTTKAVLAETLAELAILEWSGVLTPAGEPAAVVPANTAHLMAIPEMAGKLLEQLYAPLERLAAEGNGSSAAPSGTSATALPTAAPAATPAAAPAVPM